MKLYKNLISILLLIIPIMCYTQAEVIFNGIRLEDSVETVAQKLGEISETTNIISKNNPSFPLAEVKEEHLICSKVKTKKGMINKVAFVFADSKLKYIEARGNVYKTLANARTDTARSYLDYDVYIDEKLFLNKKKDAAWILTKEAMHTNLFTWENPYLNLNYKNGVKLNYSNQIPAFLKMGAPIDELKPLFETNSDFTNTEELDGKDPNAQFQVNCFGVMYLGFPRKVEARFGDDKLNVVWILTGKGEENRIRKALINQYGDPIFVNGDWEIFDNWQVGLRKDKPEVLLMKKEIGLEYKTNYFKQ